MLQDITSLISDVLAAIYPRPTIYRENISQGFSEPCFVITQLKLKGNDELKGRQMRHLSYSIKFFPDSKSVNPGAKEQCEAVLSTLMAAFKRVPGISRLYDKEGDIVDEVVVFTFDLIYRIEEVIEEVLMDSIDLEVEGSQ